ncbi:nucleoside-diphosphate kinase [Amycolatopsis sp. 195334CR]|nr:nucleoside-diphosphate kinase [Amycolatopsis sp. 195334CR]
MNNLIHTSDDPAAAWREVHIWFGGHRAAHLLGTAPRPAQASAP